MRARIALASLALSCGGAQGITINGGCSASIAGSQSGTFDCNAASGGFDTAHGTSAVGLSVPGTTAITVAVGFPGDLHTGTFTNATAGATGGATIQLGGTTSNTIWGALAGSSNPAQNQGTWTLIVTDTGTATTNSSGKAYLGMHGTFDATAPPVPGGTATGTETLHAAF